jgi:arylsulfatase A-like enzyme
MVYASDTYGLDQGFDHYRYYGRDGEKRGPLLVYDVGKWLEAHARERTLLYVHLRRPHSPYDPPRSAWESLPGAAPEIDPARFALLQHADARVRSGDELSADELEILKRLYRANLATADATVSALLQRLPAPDETLIVVLADHGEALGEHGAFGHGRTLWSEVLDVPLIVAGPGVRAAVLDAPACTLDVQPTLLEACGLSPPADAARLAGVSLWTLLTRGIPPPAREPVAIMTRSETATPDVIAVVDQRWKLVLGADGELELYDRIEDPADTAPVQAPATDVVARLLEHARTWLAEHRAAMQRQLPEPELDTETIERLLELGYVR